MDGLNNRNRSITPGKLCSSSRDAEGVVAIHRAAVTDLLLDGLPRRQEAPRSDGVFPGAAICQPAVTATVGLCPGFCPCYK